MKYCVGNDDFVTIQSAIDAAVNAGHNVGNPTVVFVKPGIYTEDVSMASGVDIVALDYNATVLQGTVNVNLSDSSGQPSCLWSGISIKGESYGVNFAGANNQQFRLDNCKIRTEEEGIFVHNTSSGANLVSKDVMIEQVFDSQCLKTTGTNAASVFFENARMGDWGSGSDKVVVEHNGGAVYFTTQSLIGGQVVVNATAGGFVFNGALILQTATALVLNSTTIPCILGSIAFLTSASEIISGTGTVIMGTYMRLPGSNGVIGSGITIQSSDIGFIPGVVTDWSVAPLGVYQALNQLAARVKALEA